jgi:catechol-2,3-dioxygenase
MKIHELGHIVLYVSDLRRSADFYKNILGFNEIHRDLHSALYSAGRTHHELLLIEVGGTPQIIKAPSAGLYHAGFKVGNSDEELRAVYNELVAHNVQILGMTGWWFKKIPNQTYIFSIAMKIDKTFF